MRGINRLTVVLATALGGTFVAAGAIAGPGCSKGAMTAPDYQQNYYQPALYRPAPGDYGVPRAYRTGMGYEDHRENKVSTDTRADIVDTAIEASDFNTLVAAVKAAGLVETLKGQGPFTVFAPTDAAFAKIPQDQLNVLLNDKAALTRVLTYHVVAGKYEAADVVTMTRVATVEGQSLTIDAGDAVMVDNAEVIKTDIQTSNGVIHVIDSVMLPPDMLTQR